MTKKQHIKLLKEQIMRAEQNVEWWKSRLENIL